MSSTYQRTKLSRIKYIGNSQICSKYVPFAKDKAKKLDKKFKSRPLERNYTMDNGVIIQIRVTKSHHEITITGSAGYLEFGGYNISSTQETFKTDGTAYKHTGSHTSFIDFKYVWKNTQYVAMSGIGTDYAYPFTGPSITNPAYDEFVPTQTGFNVDAVFVRDRVDNILYQSDVSFLAVSSAVYEGFVIGINERNKFFWVNLNDTDTVHSEDITLPTWIGEEIVINPGVIDNGRHTAYQGWLDGDGGIAWKFNSTATKLIGMVYEIIRYNGQIPDSADPDDKPEIVPHIIQIDINPAINNESLTINPVVTCGDREPFLMGIDWYHLDKDEYNVISYIKVTQQTPDNIYRAELTTKNLDTDIETTHQSFVVFSASGLITDHFMVKVTSIDLRYHTFTLTSLHENAGNLDFISFAKGFDADTWVNTIGNSTLLENLLDYSTIYQIKNEDGELIDPPPLITGNTPLSDIDYPFTQARRNCMPQIPMAAGYGCSSIDNSIKKFAYMSLPEVNSPAMPEGDTYYDIIKIGNKEYTHESCFSSFGFNQTVDIDNKLKGVYHSTGYWY